MMNPPHRFRVKICGITRMEDALCAVAAGVDALGFIFAAKSPRRITPEAARAIIEKLPPFVTPVGVFVDAPLRDVRETITACRLGAAQLHGTEPVSYCRELDREAPACRILKAIRVGPQTLAAETLAYRGQVSGLLLDTYDPRAAGGTGVPFDWSLIAPLIGDIPFVLAGGLNPDNIDKALVRVRPYAVDANSGLEDAPGIKNHGLIRRFLSTVRSVEAAMTVMAAEGRGSER